MEIKQDLTPVNFTPDGMKEVRGVVLHSMAGTQAGSIAWFKNPNAKASAHYCISKTGEIVQCVLDKDMAWHAGLYDEPIADWLKPNPNYYCIGIELEDENNENWSYPEAQRKALAWLCVQLVDKYGIALDHIVLHKELNPSRRHDPIGAFSKDWLFAEMKQLGNSTSDPLVLTDESVRAIYGGLRNDPATDDEVKWRIEQAKGLRGLIEDICGNDGGFLKRWVQPHVDSAVEQAKQNLESEWQKKLSTANDQCDIDKKGLDGVIKDRDITIKKLTEDLTKAQNNWAAAFVGWLIAKLKTMREKGKEVIK